MVTAEKPAVRQLEEMDFIPDLNRARDIEKYLDTWLPKPEGWPQRLSTPQARVLGLVAAHDGLTPSDIAKHMHQETHSISGLLNRLEDHELLDRRRDRQDRRVVHVHLTPAGEQLLDAVRGVFEKAEAQFR